MAFCTQCGQKLGEEHKFCASCGTANFADPETPQKGTTAVPSDYEDDVDAEEARLESPPAPVQQGVSVGGAVTFALVSIGLLIAVILGTGVFEGDSTEEESQPSVSASTPAPAPAPVEVETWDNDISQDDCAVIEAQTDYLKFLYSGDSFTGTSGDLSSASDVFTQIAGSYTGSDRDWLLKMAELSDEVAQGSDARAKPLKANLGLTDQFCG